MKEYNGTITGNNFAEKIQNRINYLKQRYPEKYIKNDKSNKN